MTPEERRDRVILVGHHLFGRPGRLTAGMFCWLHQPITNREYQLWCQSSNLPALPSLGAETGRFEDLGMLRRLPVRTQEHQWVRTESPLWSIFGAVVEAVYLGKAVPALPGVNRDEMIAELVRIDRKLAR